MRYKNIFPKAKEIIYEQKSFLSLSFVLNLLTGSLKLITGISTSSVIVIVNGVYSMVLCAARLLQIWWIKITRAELPYGSTYTTRVLNAAAIILLGCIFSASGVYTYRSQKILEYGTYSVYILALCTFVKLIVGIVGVSKFRHDRENVMFSVKMTNLTDALMSLVITQSAIMSIEHKEDAYIYDGIYGTLVGIAVAFIGVGMLIYVRLSKKEAKKQT